MTTVETTLLLLRPFAAGDRPRYREIRGDPEVARFLPGGAASRQETDERADRTLRLFAEHWRQRGFGPWAVIDRRSGALIGHAGLRHLEEFDAVELLYTLDRPFWGRGLASEAAQAALEHGFGRLGLDRTIALALPENKASRRVMEKAGFSLVGMTRFLGHEVVRYELSANDWKTREGARSTAV